MKDKSIGWLLANISDPHYFTIGGNKCKAEILSRFAELEKEVERLKNPIIESLHYDQNGLDIWASHPIIKVLAEETVRLLKLSNAENFVVVSLYDKERNGYTLTIKKNNGKSIEEKYEEVSKEVENLKCCGNCDHVWLSEIIEKCKIDEPNFIEKNVCDNWQSDNMTREERK